MIVMLESNIHFGLFHFLERVFDVFELFRFLTIRQGLSNTRSTRFSFVNVPVSFSSFFPIWYS